MGSTLTASGGARSATARFGEMIGYRGTELSTEHFLILYGLVDGTVAVILRHWVIVEGKGNDPEGSVSHGIAHTCSRTYTMEGSCVTREIHTLVRRQHTETRPIYHTNK